MTSPVLRMAAALVCMTSPVLLVLLVWRISPASVERVCKAYTLWPMGTTTLVEEALRPGSEVSLQSLPRLFAERMLIETLVRAWNVLREGAVLAAGLAAAAVLVQWLGARLARGRARGWILETAAFFGISLLLGCAFWTARWCVAFSMAASIAYALNFPFPRGMAALLERAWGPLALGVGIVATAGAAHVLAPAPLLGFVGWCLAPNSSLWRRAAIAAGRVAAALFGFGALSIAFLSLRPMPLSASAARLLSDEQLYDVEIDGAANRVLVTTKYARYRERHYAFALSDLNAPPIRFYIASDEVEDILLDEGSRKIYHADHKTGNILVLNADTFESEQFGRILGPRSQGSTKLALDQASGRLLISWENDNLFLVDLATHGYVWAGRVGNVNLLPDRLHGVVYMNREREAAVSAIDSRTGEVRFRAAGPKRNERMVLSEQRGELYVPDPSGGRIWVYSRPDLRLLRKIPSQYVVRALAVDDEHGLLLAASVVSGCVDVIDLEKGEMVQRRYVGPYCRIMQVHAPSRRTSSP